MNDYAALIDKYFAGLNETDDQRRRRLIEEVWAEIGSFASPVGSVSGQAAINQQIQGFQKQFPQTLVRRTGPIDVLADRYLRFAFEAARPEGAAFIRGVDFALIDDGKLQLVAGFFDSEPGAAVQ